MHYTVSIAGSILSVRQGPREERDAGTVGREVTEERVRSKEVEIMAGMVENQARKALIAPHWLTPSSTEPAAPEVLALLLPLPHQSMHV